MPASRPGTKPSGLILQHGEDGPPAHFSAWCERRGIAFGTRRVWEGELPADPAGYGWICSLGSDETPGAAGRPEWVDDEVGFLRDALDADVPVLGLCFGGQALATAAGGSVALSEPAEVGWLRIESFVPELVPAGPWLHFHYAQLHPPERATELARSPAGTAAFRLGRNLGLQFHPEATPAIADEWARLEAAELARLGISPEEVAEQGRSRGGEAAAAAERLFDAWWESLEG
jgi:GMP synthase-like glutamine amidotransferase